jgi:hypothetical protein
MASSSLSEGAAASIMNKAVPQGNLADLCAALGDFESLAVQVSDLKEETLEKEASVLKAILDRVTPLVPVLSRDFESYYRRELVILTEREEVKFEKSAEFYSEYKLVLYENGLLVRIHRYGEFSEGPRPGWELTNEEEFTPLSAIIAFGLPAIADGLIKTFGWANTSIILKEELEARLKTLVKVLEALTCTA